MGSHLDQLARHHGISPTRPSPDNVEVPVSDETKWKVLAALGVNQKSVVTVLKQQSSKTIPKSYLPKALKQGRVWGISLQLYELRSKRNWGIGDFEDLAGMIRFGSSLGADSSGLTHCMHHSSPPRIAAAPTSRPTGRC